MTSCAPLKTAPASGVWPRSFTRFPSAPRAQHPDRVGVAVIGGEHHQGVAAVVGEVGRDARVDVRHECLGLPLPGQIEDLGRQLHDLGVGGFAHQPDHLSLQPYG